MKDNQYYFGVNSNYNTADTKKYIRIDGITYTCDNPSDISLLVRLMEAMDLKRCVDKWSSSYNKEEDADNTVPVKYCVYNYDPNQG